MGLYRELCFVLMGTLIFSILLLYESRKLDGYAFPVYATDFCPRNQTEWNERFSAINCNKTNGYICLPNRELTQLLEFCYLYPFLWMQEYNCFYLNKQRSIVNNYKCRHFEHGCPTSAYMSSKSFEYQSCVTIGNGCFIADPFCNSITTSPLESTYLNYIDDVTVNVKYNTTTYFKNSTEETNKGNGRLSNNNWILPLTIILGIFIVLLVVCLIGMHYRKGHTALKRRHQMVNENMELAIINENAGHTIIETNSRIEGDKGDENSPLIKRQDQMDDTENGTDRDSAQGYTTCKRRNPLEGVGHTNEMELMANGTDKDSRQESSLDLAMFHYWEKEHVMFIPTTACKEVESLINTQNLVIVVGHSGSGKSAIIQHIALKYRSEGWAVKPVRDVDEILKAYNILQNKTLFVINDPIGKESFDEMAFASWKKYDSQLRACLMNIKMLISCRKGVQCDIKAEGFFKDNSNIIDIDSGKCILSDDEKRQILNKYKTKNYVFSERDLKKVLKTNMYFPLLCKLFFSDPEKQKDVVNFFIKPLNIIEEEIRAFRNDCKEKYCALILIVLFNNKLCVGDLRYDKNSGHMYEHALERCGMNTTTEPYKIGNALETLKNVFVSKIGNTYQFCHDLIMEITSHVFGSEYPGDMIKYADIVFLRKRVKLEDSRKDQPDQLTIYISDTHLDSLAERLLKEVVGANIFDVVLNPLLKDEKVAHALKKNIGEDKAKIETLFKKLFVKEKLRLEKQNFNEKSEKFFFSKLDFLNLNSYVTPVCALIVFSHVDLSIYCLNALQQLDSKFKDSSVFFAVCCNGAIDLLNMFSEDDIKTYLRERCGYLYPIHIVSVFHNHEILQKFIQLGVDLNQRDKYGYTALMNTLEVSEYNNTNAAYYHTLKLLLRKEADVNLCDEYGNSPLYIACKNGRDSTVQLLLSNEADVNLCNKFGESPLYIPCKNGRDSTVQLLLSNEADVNLCDELCRSPLYIACENRHDSTVHLLLSNGANANLCNKLCRSPLYIACENGHDSTVHLLLSNRADVNLCDEFGESPLYIACKIGRNSTVQLLLSNGADVNLCDKYRRSPLFKACQSGHVSTVQLLLSKEADVNLCDKYGNSPLYIACKNGRDSTVQLLLRNEADVNLCDELGESPLYIACENGYDSTVQLLLSNEADVNLCEDLCRSPLYVACENGYDSTVQLLLSNGADVNLCEDLCRSPLYVACENGRESTVQLLLSNGANVNLCDKFGESPLYIACENGHDSTVHLLLSNGANVDLCDESGRGPLIAACKNGRDRAVQHLLSNEADVNLCDKFRRSPLEIACKNGHDSTVQLLLSNGADVNLCDVYGNSPLYKACENGRHSTVQLLLSNEADINLCCKYGGSPLIAACEKGHDSTVQLLLSHGADINLCNEYGNSPLYTACENGRHSTVQLLLNSKADINLNKKNPALIAFYMRQHAIIKTFLDAGVITSIVNYCQLKYVSSDWCDKDDITGQYLLRKDNIVDNMYDLDSFFSLFVFCQVEELTREYNDPL